MKILCHPVSSGSYALFTEKCGFCFPECLISSMYYYFIYI